LTAKPVLPKGTLVEGHLETSPARRPMRRGHCAWYSIASSCPTKGRRRAWSFPPPKRLRQGRQRRKTVHPHYEQERLAIQLGGTALVAKLADDLSEEVLATTAGSARWYGWRPAYFPAAAKGREVKLSRTDN